MKPNEAPVSEAKSAPDSLSIRDYFAGQAFGGFLSRSGHSVMSVTSAAECAYAAAAEMMRARRRHTAKRQHEKQEAMHKQQKETQMRSAMRAMKKHKDLPKPNGQ